MATETDPYPIVPPILIPPLVAPVHVVHSRILVMFLFLIMIYLYSHFQLY